MRKTNLIRTPLAIALCGLFAAGPASAADMNLSVEVPRIDVAEYHRPYVAVWIEREDKSVAANLAVWYQQKRAGGGQGMGGAAGGAASVPPAADAAPAVAAAAPAPGAAPGGAAAAEGGTKWLPDLRQWWRRTGRELKMPMDGVSSATRVVGQHQLSFSGAQAPLAGLPAGQYRLVVEAAREEGGRELLDIPFKWPATEPQQLKAQGSRELGALTLELKP